MRTTAAGAAGVMTVAPAASWEADYERDFSAQKRSGPVVFTEDQRRKNRELCGRVRDLLPFEDAYKVSDCDLMYRFLIGKHWNVATTEKGLREYAQLRKSDRLDYIIAEQLNATICGVLSPLNKGEPCPIYGLDKEGLPVLWLSPDAAKLIAAMKEFTSEQLLRGQLRSMELGRYACLQHKVDRCTYVIDLGGITMSSVNKATLAMLKGVMNLLQVAYPEIMRRLLIFNTGWAVSAAWKVLRPLVDVRVQDKIKFESGPPTLAALQPYMAADQVHPAFGGTGTANVLDPIIADEVHRLRQKVEGSLRKAVSDEGADARAAGSPANAGSTTAATPTTALRASSMDSRQNTSLVEPDAITLYSICSNSPYETACRTPCESPAAASAEAERMVIGKPSAVAAYMDRAQTELMPRNALDLSLSGDSSSEDYAFPTPGDSDDVSWGAVSPPGGDAARVPRPRTGQTRSLSPSARRGTIVPPPSQRPDVTASLPPPPPPQQQQQQQHSGNAVVAISLTYGADGSISGYCGRRWVGRFREGVLYVPGPGEDGNRGGGVGVRAGELLSEAGHPVHSFLIVCDAQRRVRYLLRESLLRTRLSIFNIVGDAVVQTGKSNRHYVEGERAKLGVVLPHVHAATCGGKGAWMLYGEDVTKRSSAGLKPLRPLQQLFSKPKLSSSVKADKSGSGSGEAPLDGPTSSGSGSGNWPSSVIAAIRSSAPFSPVKSRARAFSPGASSGRSFPTPSQEPLRRENGSRVAEAASSEAAARVGEALLLAECKGQTVSFYNLLATNPVTDLFALSVAITQSWSHEVEGLRAKAASAVKPTRYSSEDDVIS